MTRNTLLYLTVLHIRDLTVQHIRARRIAPLARERPPTQSSPRPRVPTHHGLPTRLLDWTLNPLVGLYFAVEPDGDQDSAVYAKLSSNWIDGNRIRRVDPLSITEVSVFAPPYISPRIRAQAGHFTVQPDPTEPLTADQSTKITSDKRSS